MVSFLIAYATMSGNTQEVAEIIHDEIGGTLYRIGSGEIPTLSHYDMLVIGTYTWDKGSTPDEVKDFVLDVGYKPSNVAVFGTGDTQFGGDTLFCRAVDRLERFYKSQHKVLKIEQSPRGTQSEVVRDWARGLLNEQNK